MGQLSHSGDEGDHWISVSDLMSGLMVFFLFIAIAYITNIGVTYEDLQTTIYDELYEEFKDDLPRWNATIDKGRLSVRFNEPDVLFARGSSELRPEFTAILEDFFPRYLSVLTRDHVVSEIEEVRIEGHTSSEWDKGVTGLPAYVENMRLSQDRTRAVLAYVMQLPAVAAHGEWLIGRLTANGLSSSRLVRNADGGEDSARSRRVEFRIRTDSESRVLDIIRNAGDDS